jgi:hypothetical protein
MCRILEQHSFNTVRRRDSHIVMQRRVSDSMITVAVPITANSVPALFNRLSASANSPEKCSRKLRVPPVTPLTLP